MNDEWLHFDSGLLDAQAGHDLLKCLVIPRPIAWITTLGEDGLVNLAPYSCYAIAGFSPMTVIVGFESALGRQQKKQTLLNIERTGEFVIHTVTEKHLDSVNTSARPAMAGESKLDACGLTPLASSKIAPPRIREAPLAMECRSKQIIPLGDQHHLVIAEGIVVHAHSSIVCDGKIDTMRLAPIGRMNDNCYVRLRDTISLPRP